MHKVKSKVISVPLMGTKLGVIIMLYPVQVGPVTLLYSNGQPDHKLARWQLLSSLESYNFGI